MRRAVMFFDRHWAGRSRGIRHSAVAVTRILRGMFCNERLIGTEIYHFSGGL
jgi:hypothetical protein